MLYMVDAVRYGLLGISDVPVGLSFTLIGVLAIVLFLAGVKLLAGGKGVRD
jgi:ABC-2 type transport system permease protein